MSKEYIVHKMIDAEYKKLEGINDRLEVLHEMQARGLEVFTSWESMSTKNLKGVRDRLDPNLYPDPYAFRNEKTVSKFLEDFIEKNPEVFDCDRENGVFPDFANEPLYPSMAVFADKYEEESNIC